MPYPPVLAHPTITFVAPITMRLPQIEDVFECRHGHTVAQEGTERYYKAPTPLVDARACALGLGKPQDPAKDYRGGRMSHVMLLASICVGTSYCHR